MPLTSNPDCSFKAPTPLLGVLKPPSQQAWVLGPPGGEDSPGAQPATLLTVPLLLRLQMLSCLEHMYHDLGLVRDFSINPITLKRWLVSVGPLPSPEHSFIEFPGNGPWVPSFGPGLPADKGHTPVRILRGPIPNQTLSDPKLLSVREKIVGTRESQVKSVF